MIGGERGGEVCTEAFEATPVEMSKRVDDCKVRENLLQLNRRIETIDGTAPEIHVESLRTEAAELAGVDSYNEIDFNEL